jgi:metallo-beta-lactamase class B
MVVLVAVVWLRLPRAFAPRPVTVSRLLLPEAVAVAPGVYLLGKTDPAAVYLVETAEGLVLIDSGVEDNGSTVTEQILKLGFDVKQLRAILLTHVHADHSMGAAHLRELTGAKVYVGRADCEPLLKGAPLEAFTSTFYMPHVVPHVTPVDVKLEGDETIAFGETRFVVIAAPGHTAGSVCYLLERPGLRALFTGDVVLHLNPAVRDSLGTYAAYLAPHFGGNVRDYLTSLRRLRALPLPDLVLPGHPRMGHGPQNPRLSAERWHALLDQGIADMERLQTRFQVDGANFLDGTPRELLPGLHYFGDLGDRAIYCLSTSKGRFLVDAPGGPELLDFLANQCKRLGWENRTVTAVLLTSADRAATAGLTALVQATGCQVVAPRAGLEEVRRLCPAGTRVVTEEDLEKSGWFEVHPIALEGRGLAPLAYEVRWAGKTVLISGRIPMKLNTPTADDLWREIRGAGGSVEQYVKSLERLEQVNPNLWLPAVPVHGQNANLYDRAWASVLAQNRQLIAP